MSIDRIRCICGDGSCMMCDDNGMIPAPPAGKSPDLRPRCPRCGTPARNVSGMARVRLRLDANGATGEVVRVSSVKEMEGNLTYMCGGSHQWIVPAQ